MGQVMTRPVTPRWRSLNAVTTSGLGTGCAGTTSRRSATSTNAGSAATTRNAVVAPTYTASPAPTRRLPAAVSTSTDPSQTNAHIDPGASASRSAVASRTRRTVDISQRATAPPGSVDAAGCGLGRTAVTPRTATPRCPHIPDRVGGAKPRG